MRLKVKEFFSFLVALAFLVGWVAGANAGFKAVWNQPVHTSDGGTNQQNGKVCQDPSGNTAIVWDNGTDVFMQLISPDGMRLLTGEAGALTYGYTVLDRSSSLTLDAATCLADGSVFVVANDTSTYYMQLVSGGARQWGLDAQHKYGKMLISGTFPKMALLPSGSNVVVAFGNSTATYYTMVDSAGNKDCGGSDWCEISLGSNDTLAVIPGSDFWLVGASGGTFNVYGVSGDSYEQVFSSSVAYDTSKKFIAISDGNGGVVVVYNGTQMMRICDINSSQPGTFDGITDVSSVKMEGSYIYASNGTTLCKYELATDCTSTTQLTKIWCTTESVQNDMFTLVGDKIVLTKRNVNNDLEGILVDDENGKVLLRGVIIDNDTYGFDITENKALFGGNNDAYTVFDDNTSRYAELKFTWTIAPDFTVSGVNVSGEVSTAEDRPLVVQFTANNTGSLDAPSDVVVKFYLTNSTSLDEKVLVGEYTVPAADLKAGASKTYSGITLTISKNAVNEIMKKIDGTTLYLAAVINEDKAVTEDDYTNNFASSTIPNVYAPNLTISSCASDPSTGLKAGDTVTITCTVQNNGSAPAENIEVAFKYDETVLNSVTIASLAPSGSNDISANVTLPTCVGDSFNVTAYVDPNNLIGETNDSDNSRDILFTGVTTGPDLVVDAAAVNPVTVTPGMEVTASVVVKNIGGATASASVLNLYLSTDNSFDSGDTLLAAQAIDSLASKASVAKTIYFDVPNNIDAGTYYVLFVADAANTVDELNENNNVYAQQITVTGAGANCPDLTLVVSNVGGNAEIWVAVPSCGDYCGFPATVAIQADLDGDSAVDYSFVPGMGYYGWVPGEQTFVYPLSVVPAVPVLDDWMGVPYSALSNATITFNVQVGECNVTETWTP